MVNAKKTHRTVAPNSETPIFENLFVKDDEKMITTWDWYGPFVDSWQSGKLTGWLSVHEEGGVVSVEYGMNSDKDDPNVMNMLEGQTKEVTPKLVAFNERGLLEPDEVLRMASAAVNKEHRPHHSSEL